MSKPVKVLFVCLGNICRSPTAHGVFEALLRARQLERRIHVDSAATSDWHIGKAPDPRSIAMAAERGVDLSTQRARQVSVDDFYEFDYILAMDKQNLQDLQRLAPADGRAHLSLLLTFDDTTAEQEVPDPYYGGKSGFAHVVDLVEGASEALLAHIQRHNLDASDREPGV